MLVTIYRSSIVLIFSENCSSVPGVRPIELYYRTRIVLLVEVDRGGSGIHVRSIVERFLFEIALVAPIESGRTCDVPHQVIVPEGRRQGASNRRSRIPNRTLEQNRRYRAIVESRQRRAYIKYDVR